MELSKAELLEAYTADRRRARRGYVALIVVALVAFLLLLGVRYNAGYYPDSYYCLPSYLYSLVTELGYTLGLTSEAQRSAVVDAVGSITYLGALARLKINLMYFVAGGALAVAGAVFQTVYKNPIASPNILGATSGVTLGNIVMVTLYSATAMELIRLRYMYCYLFAIACMVTVLLLGRLLGNKRGNPAIMETVMVGSIVSQGVNVFVLYYMYELPEEDLLVYQELTMGMELYTDAVSVALFAVSMAVALIPMLLLRYRFNAVALDDSESRVAGVNPEPIRLITQVCAGIMTTSAMIHCGTIGMISMVVPYLSRAFFGTDSRRLLLFSFVCGGLVVVLCGDVSSMILILDEHIPITFIVNIILIPAFLYILAKQKGV